MIHINEFINNCFATSKIVEEMFDEIDNEILCESFQSSIFQEITAQIEELTKKDKEETKERGYSLWNKVRNFNTMVKYYYVAWNKITDDMSTEVEATAENIKDLKKLIRKLQKENSEYTYIIIVNKNAEDEKSIKKYPSMLVCRQGDPNPHFLSLISSSEHSIKLSQLEGYLSKKFIYFKITPDLETWKLKNQRYQDKQDVIEPGNKDQYKEIAKKNIERYKKIIAKNHAENEAEDGMAQKVLEYVNKVMDLATKLSENPAKYNKFEYDIQSLIEQIGDREVYSWQRAGKPTKYGKNGLMFLFASYIKTKLSLTKENNYSSESEYKSYKKALNDRMKEIDKRYDALKAKIDEQEGTQEGAE